MCDFRQFLRFELFNGPCLFADSRTRKCRAARSDERRSEALRRITALFLHGSGRFNDDHIRLFDDVFVMLINEIEGKARAELSRQLAPVANSPAAVIHRLARDEDIVVAGPVLA